MKLNKATAIILLLALFTGCRSWPFHERSTKTKAVAGARAERMMRTSIDSELARERRGERPSAGKKTWREYWEWRISLWRKEKNRKYEQRLSQRRKELGLKKVREL